MEGAKYRGMIVGYGVTSAEVPERSPFYKVNVGALAFIEVSPLVYGIRVL